MHVHPLHVGMCLKKQTQEHITSGKKEGTHFLDTRLITRKIYTRKGGW